MFTTNQKLGPCFFGKNKKQAFTKVSLKNGMFSFIGCHKIEKQKLGLYKYSI